MPHTFFFGVCGTWTFCIPPSFISRSTHEHPPIFSAWGWTWGVGECGSWQETFSAPNISLTKIGQGKTGRGSRPFPHVSMKCKPMFKCRSVASWCSLQRKFRNADKFSTSFSQLFIYSPDKSDGNKNDGKPPYFSSHFFPVIFSPCALSMPTFSGGCNFTHKRTWAWRMVNLGVCFFLIKTKKDTRPFCHFSFYSELPFLPKFFSTQVRKLPPFSVKSRIIPSSIF